MSGRRERLPRGRLQLELEKGSEDLEGLGEEEVGRRKEGKKRRKMRRGRRKRQQEWKKVGAMVVCTWLGMGCMLFASFPYV